MNGNVVKRDTTLKQTQQPVTTTKRKIGKITYRVCSSASNRATDTLAQKVEKLIIKDMGRGKNTSKINHDFKVVK